MFCAVFGGWSRCALYPVVRCLFKGYFEGLVVIKFSADESESVMGYPSRAIGSLEKSQRFCGRTAYNIRVERQLHNTHHILDAEALELHKVQIGLLISARD